jgi:tetratricopeptide (TPR) repeat protein
MGERMVILLRPLAVADPDGRGLELAEALSDLGIRLLAAGRASDALVTTEEAVAVFSERSSHDPAERPRLAAALVSHATALQAVDRRQDALIPAREAAEMFEALAAEDPGQRILLADALDRLAMLLAHLGRYEEAFTQIRNAINLHKVLSGLRPEAYAARSPRAAYGKALSHASIVLDRLGRWPESLQAAQDARALIEPLAQDDPVAYGADLAHALDYLSAQLARDQRPVEAIEVATQAVAQYRAAIVFDPTEMSGLATALANLGQHL